MENIYLIMSGKVPVSNILLTHNQGISLFLKIKKTGKNI